MDFTLSKNWNKGLGTELMVFCTLLDYGVTRLNINLHLNNKNFDVYKKIFNVSNLTINYTTDLQNELEPGDLFKIFSPYYKIPNSKKNKKYIGIAAYQDNIPGTNLGKKYPECKYYSIDQYALLYKFIKSNGWDVVTLDGRDTSIEDKAYLISNYCECVIGYEGGIAHLCHMLDVPYIMFPWRTEFDSKILHLDEKTFFLDSFEQILYWSKEELVSCINNLHQGISNNELLTDKSLIYKKWLKHPISAEERNFLNSK